MNDLLTIGVYRIQSGSYAAQISNLPPDYGPKAGVCAVIHTLQVLASYGDTSSTFSALWMRDNYMSGSERRWTEWVKVAGCTSPQEFSLPLADGFSGTAKYSKNQFGQILLTIDITGSYSNATVIGTLPAGFRPSETVTVLARIGGGFSTIDIDSTGEVKSYNISGSASGAAFAQALFNAAS